MSCSSHARDLSSFITLVLHNATKPTNNNRAPQPESIGQCSVVEGSVVFRTGESMGDTWESFPLIEYDMKVSLAAHQQSLKLSDWIVLTVTLSDWTL